MKRIIITLYILLAAVQSASPQGFEHSISFSNPKTYTEVADSLLRFIDKDSISTGILYSRVVPFARLERFNQLHPDTSSYVHFIQAYSELKRASFGNSPFNMEVEQFRQAIDESLNAHRSVVSIGVVACNFSVLDTLAISDGRISLERGALVPKVANHGDFFTTASVFVASPLVKSHISLDVIFRISQQWIFSDAISSIASLEVDFDDGLGYRAINALKGEDYSVSYPAAGEKVLRFRAKHLNGKTVETFGRFTILPQHHAKSDVPNLPMDRQIIIEASIPFADYSGASFKGKGEVTYIYANHEKELQRPIIVVDGFDPGDYRNDFGTGFVDGEPRTESIWRLFNEPYGIADALLAQGYDIVILNFHTYDNHFNEETNGGADFIERNGLVLVELINQVSQTLQLNGSSDSLVVIGPSMGGLISRYALTYMEQNNKNHNTRLWVSFDSPHRGANISMGAQGFLFFFGELAGKAGAKKKWRETICSNAAKQMLFYHRAVEFDETAGQYRTNFLSTLNQVGFPSNLRRIAVANGSLNGTLENQACQKAFEMWRKVLGISFAHAYIRQQPGYGDECKVFDGRVPSGIVILNEDLYMIAPTGSCSFDVSPGGTFKTFFHIWEGAEEDAGDDLDENRYIFPSHSFIPTKSALAFTGSNVDLAETIGNRNLVTSGETPFHSYWGAIHKNMEHIEFDADLMCWVLNEINGISMPPVITNTISGPTTVCSSNATFTLNNLPNGYTVTWTRSSNLAYVSGQGTASYTVRAANTTVNGPGWVQATVSGLCGDVELPPYSVYVGTPPG
ncbi:MAG: hypothetical protein PHD00_12165, partial [Bacteroidales bacterium]|nr:hypothetical protein [Bacteroidales bacterium]